MRTGAAVLYGPAHFRERHGSHTAASLVLCGARRQRAAPARLRSGRSGSDGNSTYFDIGPLSDFLAYADHGIIYRFVPRAVQHTEMEVVWLVHEDAVEGKDYDVERLT